MPLLLTAIVSDVFFNGEKESFKLRFDFDCWSRLRAACLFLSMVFRCADVSTVSDEGVSVWVFVGVATLLTVDSEPFIMTLATVSNLCISVIITNICNIVNILSRWNDAVVGVNPTT